MLCVVGLIVFAEDALVVGFVLPGETAAILGGAASRGHVPLTAVLAVVVIAGNGAAVGAGGPSRRRGRLGTSKSPMADAHAGGWDNYLTRLARALAHDDLGHDPLAGQRALRRLPGHVVTARVLGLAH